MQANIRSACAALVPKMILHKYPRLDILMSFPILMFPSLVTSLLFVYDILWYFVSLLVGCRFFVLMSFGLGPGVWRGRPLQRKLILNKQEGVWTMEDLNSSRAPVWMELEEAWGLFSTVMNLSTIFCLLVMIYYLVEKDLLNTHDMKQRSRVQLTGPLPNSDGMPLNFIFL